MNKRQNAKLNMYQSVKLVMDANQLIWQVLIAMVAAFTGFTGKLAALIVAAREQEENIKGYSEQKRLRRITMAEKANEIRSAIQAFAVETGNMVLFEKVNYSLTELLSGSGNRSRSRSQIIHEEAQEHETALADYGVTPEEIAELAEAIESFATIIAQPKEYIAKKKYYTELISSLIKDIDGILKNKMDKLMENFRLTAPQFYKEYFNNRIIFDAKTNYTEIRATILNEVTGEKLEGVKMVVDGPEHDYEFLSNYNGIADAKQIHPEIYDLKFELPGFEVTEVKNVDMSPGEKELITVKLKPVE